MRKNLNPLGSKRLIYEIREIVKLGKALEAKGQTIRWENIGDPIHKGEMIPQWMKDILKNAIDQNSSWGYSPTNGLDKAIDFIIKRQNQRVGKNVLGKEDIIFFNGLGDAISTLYSRLDSTSRVICPSPCYSAHGLGESDHAHQPTIFYAMDPKKNWEPDLVDLESKLAANPSICGVMLINPDNPTGAIHSRKNLEAIVALAKKYDLFIIADEIYQNLVFDDAGFTPIIDVIGDVPAISMQGLSKEVPWPGGRCGWIEIYNRNKDPEFAFYIQRILDTKMSQVCATTLPQFVLPEILSHPQYDSFIEERKEDLKVKTQFLTEQLSGLDAVILAPPKGALYYTIVFKKELMNEWQFLEIKDNSTKELIEEQCKEQSLDKRFVLYLLASRGICSVPLSGFFTDLKGFRITLLEKDLDKFKQICIDIKEAINEYFTSTL